MAEYELELRALPHDMDHPEGVAVAPDGRVHAGGEAGQIYRVDLVANSCEVIADTGGFITGLAHDAAGNIFACDVGNQAVMRITPEGAIDVYSRGNADQGMRVPNFPAFDRAGNLYVSDSGAWAQSDGFIWRIGPGGEAEVWDRQACGFTNGLCMTPDGQALIVVESSPPCIARVPVRSDGSAGQREKLLDLPRSVPDGVAFDREGRLYISVYTPSIIYRLEQDGSLTTLYEEWERFLLDSATNVAFAGPDLRTLLVANLDGRKLLCAPVQVPGMPLNYPQLPD
ncbi:MAG: SMP-30/gluconolactonase/LRE family protein [Anaerolineaceae bacterium]|nr:SMP-30/gluconolactonase/LRE family protein [Anaerolineaceae bacterium]MCY4024460.1 SMP-30/gluconolactonase/LRE family protein [Anaerolineaceae bacterium]